jgi:hypothetical protein
MDAATLIGELKRRRVFRALIGYGIAAFAILQIIEPVMHGLHWSEEVLSYTVVALAIGFPVVVTLAWIFDVNAGRVERTAPATAAGFRSGRLAVVLAGVSLLAAAPGVLWYLFLRGHAVSPREPSVTVSSAVAQPGAPTASIAVLPFVNLSSDKEQEFFSDGDSRGDPQRAGASRGAASDGSHLVVLVQRQE